MWRNWKRRWFMLTVASAAAAPASERGMLSYYENKQADGHAAAAPDAAAALGVLRLCDYIVDTVPAAAAPGQRQHCFRLEEKSGGRAYVLGAADDVALGEWVSDIARVQALFLCGGDAC